MTVIRITKQFTFEMAHALKGHDGPCRHIHGHSYVLDVTLIGHAIPDSGSPQLGMLMDFGKLKKIVRPAIVEVFDHALVLNRDYPQVEINTTHELFEKLILVDYQPTCENMLSDFAARLIPLLPSRVKLFSLKLRETATSYAEWFASDNE